jgi:hypothetical protein
MLPLTVLLAVVTFFIQAQSIDIALKNDAAHRHVVEGLGYLWLHTFIEDLTILLDWHLGLSIVLIGVCAFQGPAKGLKGFFEISWLVITAYALATLGAIAYDWVDFRVAKNLESSFGVWSMMAWSRSPQVLVWFEPVFLVLGLAAIYNLLVIVNRSWSVRRLRN